MLELGGLPAKVFQQLTNKSSRAGGWIENFDIAVNQVPAEVLLAQPVSALDHEPDDFVGRVNDAEPVGCLGVVNLVEILVDDLQERLLLLVAGNLSGCSADGRVVRVESSQRLLLDVAGKEGGFQGVEFFGDVVLPVEVVFAKDLGEDLLGAG